MFTTIENTPFTVNLVQAGRTRGWTINGTSATHEACNAGEIELVAATFITGHTYTVTYRIDSISSGIIRPRLGTTIGVSRTAVGFKTDTIVAGGSNPKLYFYSNGDATISIVNIKDNIEDTSLKQRSTVIWSEDNNNWPAYRTQTPEAGFSLFTDFYSYKDGALWRHDRSIEPRNNFYDTQYKTFITVPFNADRAPKSFESISYESNKLMVTTTDGIETSLGQVSELIDQDFLKDVLEEGVNEVKVYDVEGVYSAGFLCDKNVDLINGDPLKGSYVTVELTNVSDGKLRLKNVIVNSTRSAIGAR